MREKIYTIPVNDAFDAGCECPVCAMYDKLEREAVEFTMGPSYMNDDFRTKTDEQGFCQKHIQQVYDMNNRLGMAWVMKTHLDKTVKDIKKLQGKPIKPMSLFKKDEAASPLLNALHKLNNSCFVCSRVDDFFMRYVDTIFMLWEDDSDFRAKYKNSKGFCNLHYEVLLTEAPKKLRGQQLEEFIRITDELYITNMERLRDDVAWFINKFDYKYKDEPWKDAKDSLIRAATKTNCIIDISGEQQQN